MAVITIEALKLSLASGETLTGAKLENLIDTLSSLGVTLTTEQLEDLKGDSFTFEDFTAEQLNSLKGDKGDDFTFEDFTATQLEALKGDNGIGILSTSQSGNDLIITYTDSTTQTFVDFFLETSSFETTESIQALGFSTTADTQALIDNAAIEGVEITGAKFLYENDWHDPNFIKPVNQTTDTGIDSSWNDFYFAYDGDYSVTTIDGFNCHGHRSINTNLNQVVPRFSRSFLQDKGYDDGNSMRLGLWVKIPDADAVNTRRLYFDNTGTGGVVVVDNPSWNWYEIPNNIVIDSNDWQEFTLGVRDLPTNELWFMRGLTITNTTKDSWVGERNSSTYYEKSLIPIVNENPYSVFIYENSPIFASTFEQNSNPFTISIENTIGTEPFYGNYVRTVGADATRSRVNFAISNLPVLSEWRPDLLMLPQSKREVFVKIGAWIRVTAEADVFTVFMNNDSQSTEAFRRNKWDNQTRFNEWVFIESLPQRFGVDDLKNITDELLQIDCTPNSGTVTFDVGAITITSDSDPLLFRVEQANNVAISQRLYNKKYGSLGDSVVQANGYQTVIGRYTGCESAVRGVGGSTAANSGQIIYTELDGTYISRNDVAAPSGTEGVDYLTIESSFCNEIVSTMPLGQDFLTVSYGINDHGQDIPIGSISDAATGTTGNSFYAGLKEGFDQMLLRFPNKEIVALGFPTQLGEQTTLNSNGNTFQDYRNALESVANCYGFPYIETHKIGVNQTNVLDYTTNSDGTHPNRNHHKMIGKYLVNELNRYSVFDYLKNF